MMIDDNDADDELLLQETTVLRNHAVRPGQLLVFFERVTVAKLAVSRDDCSDVGGRRCRHLLVPLSHGGRFRRTGRDSSVPSPLQLADLSRSPLGYPFTLTYHEQTDYNNLQDELLPARSLMRADGIVDEDSVLVARISDDDELAATLPPGRGRDSTETVNAQDAFHLPLRTKLTVCLGRTLTRPVRRVVSCRSDMAEELSEDTYNKLVGIQSTVEIGYVRPQIRPTIGSCSTRY